MPWTRLVPRAEAPRMDEFDDVQGGLSEGARSRDEQGKQRIAVVCPDSAADAAYFAAALARHLARSHSEAAADSREPIVLVDGQPGTGGLDVVLDLDTAGGARWAALRGAGGDIDAHKLLAALPERDGVRVLSHGRGAPKVPETFVRDAVVAALAHHAATTVVTLPPHEPLASDACDVVVLIVRGTVCSMAAAQQYVDQLDGSILPVLVTLEADSQARVALAEALDLPVVTSGPTRWRLGHHAADDVLAGRWPGEGERTMARLVLDVVIYIRSQGRSLSWA